MKAQLVCILIIYSVWYVVPDDPCAVDGVPVLNVTDILRFGFGQSKYTDEARQGESIFNRDPSLWNVSKENDLLFDEEPAQIQNLINRWTAAGYSTSADRTHFMNAFEDSIGTMGYGVLIFGIFDPNKARAYYRFMSIRKKNQRLIVVYTFLVLKLRDTRVNFALPENRALMEFIDYQDRKNFHGEQGVKVQQFLEDFSKCQ